MLRLLQKPCSIWNNTELQRKQQPSCASSILTSASACTANGEGTKGHRRSSSAENSHGAPRPGGSRYQLPDQNDRKPTQEAGFTQQDRNTSSKKTRAVTKSPLHGEPHLPSTPVKTQNLGQSVFKLPTQQPCNQALYSKPAGKKQTIAMNDKKRNKMLLSEAWL